jgi:inosine-uridine nucleoside N-ribohydrolase
MSSCQAHLALIAADFSTEVIVSEPIKVFCDTDIGDDDALGIAMLLRAPNIEVVGFTTVAGNTTVENATRNLLTLLKVAGRQIPVTVGSARPLIVAPSHQGTAIHGPDGFWNCQQPYDLTAIPRDAPKAIADAARANPGLTLLALGPLTNVAHAIQQYPELLATINIVALVGGKRGNITPLAEFNAWFDPDAVNIVLRFGVNLTIVTLDAWSPITVDPTALTEQLRQSTDPLAHFLVNPLCGYAAAQTMFGGHLITIPDALAAAYIIDPSMGTPQPALVKVSPDTGGITRGLIVIGITPGEKIAMIGSDDELSDIVDHMYGDPNFNLHAAMASILGREPDNARVILSMRHTALDEAIARLCRPE